jgi:hypothetical protein
MTSGTSLLDPREGRTQTAVLAAIAAVQYHDGTPPRQVDLDERLPASKGAISTNCSKLVDVGLVRETEGRRYEVVEDELLELYREHVDAYLARESTSARFDSEVEASNDIRTGVKRDLRALFTDESPVLDCVLAALVAADRDSRLRTFRDIVHRADHLIRSTAAHVVTHPAFDGQDDDAWETVEPILRLAVVLERVHADLDVLAAENETLAQFFPGNPPAATSYDYLTNTNE